jgi:hypothetical protein
MTTRTYRASASEHQEQCALIEWCRTFAGQHPDLAYIVAVPNGGARPILVGVAMKAEGVSPGYPDLLLDVARGGYHGWRGELKKVGGSVAPEHGPPTRILLGGFHPGDPDRLGRSGFHPEDPSRPRAARNSESCARSAMVLSHPVCTCNRCTRSKRKPFLHYRQKSPWFRLWDCWWWCG